MARRKLTAIKTVLRAGLAVAVLAYLLYLVEFEVLAATVRAAEAAWLVAALALLPLNLGLEAYGWRLLARHAAPEVPMRAALTSVLAGHTLGMATPARLGELAGRAYALPVGRRGPLAALVYAHRLAAMTVGVGFGLVAFGYFLMTQTPAPVLPWALATLYGTVIFSLLLAVLLSPRRLFRLMHCIRRLRKHREAFEFLQTMRPRAMGALLGLEGLRYGVYTSQFVLLLLAFGAEGLGTAFLGVALVYYAKFLLPPLVLFDLGIREGAAVFFFGMLGFSAAASFSAALLLFSVNLLIPALLGTPYLLRLQRKGELQTTSSLSS